MPIIRGYLSADDNCRMIEILQRIADKLQPLYRRRLTVEFHNEGAGDGCVYTNDDRPYFSIDERWEEQSFFGLFTTEQSRSLIEVVPVVGPLFEGKLKMRVSLTPAAHHETLSIVQAEIGVDTEAPFYYSIDPGNVPVSAR